jgi:hypothetical protein
MTTDASGREFDLHSLVRSVTDGSGLRGPREIAAKVAENVPAGKRLTALEEALVPYVRVYLQHARQPAPPAPTGVGARNSARSSKVHAIREGWRRTLAGQFHVGAGHWQVLADCSYENVTFLAGERHENARRSAATAAMFDQLAEAMRSDGVDRVGDLPDSVLAQILATEVAA